MFTDYDKLSSEAWAQLLLALPVSASLFLRNSIDISSLIFVGHLTIESEHFLSAAGLASVTANMTGYSMLVGLAGALATLCSQAHGLGDKEALCLALQRSFLILPLLVALPVTILWCFSASILRGLRQDSAIANDAHLYLLSLIPALWASSFSISIQNWLHSQERMVAIFIITLIIAMLHPLWCYITIFVLNMGFLGAARAVSMSKCLELLLLYLYLQFSGILAANNFAWSRKCLDPNGWIPYLQYGLPNLLMMGEWWASEIAIFMAGSLPSPETEVAAMSVFQSVNSMCFMLPSGFQVAASTRVGKHLGANDATSAGVSCSVAPAMAMMISALMAMLVLLLRSQLGLMFTEDERVLIVVKTLFLVLSLYVIFDGIQSALTGVLKGMGRQALAAPVVLIAYYVIGLPLAATFGFAFGLGWGATGICIGTTVGVAAQMTAYMLIVGWTDWDAEAERAQIELMQRRALDWASEEGDWWSLDYRSSPRPVIKVRKPLHQRVKEAFIGMFRGSDEATYRLVSTNGDYSANNALIDRDHGNSIFDDIVDEEEETHR